MEKPKILLLGRKGQIGWELCRTLAPMGDVLAPGSGEVDLKDAGALRRIVLETRPAIIINAAAYTAVDQAESEPELARRVNGAAPGVLAEAAKQTGAWLVHFSTDYIFDGGKGAPYLESDAPNPLGVYGQTKLEGEEAVRAADGKHLIFRLCWVYGARGRNFMLTMQRLARAGKPLRVVRDQTGCPTWSRLIAEATTLAVRQAVTAKDSDPLRGTYHLAAGGFTSWHGFATKIMEWTADLENRPTVAPIAATEYPTPARRPAYSVLDCGKLKNVFGIELPHWEESLRLVLDQS